MRCVLVFSCTSLTCRNVEDCTEGLNNGTADALLMAAPSLQYAINTAYCNRLMTVGSTFNEFNYVAYLAKDSPLTRPLSDAILGVCIPLTRSLPRAKQFVFWGRFPLTLKFLYHSERSWWTLEELK